MEKKYLQFETITIDVIPNYEDADFDYPFDNLSDWKFFEEDSELHAEYVGNDPDQDELELVWIRQDSHNEDHWDTIRFKDEREGVDN